MFAALCDDDKYIIEELKKLLLTYAKKNRIIIDIDEFESGEKLLNSENNYDIIVLDFQLGSTD
jgi:DNA-binding LytR/AlgR family response regulator